MTDKDVLRFSEEPGGASLGFGAMRLSTSADRRRKMFDTYLESGFNYFDTAYIYGNSEAVLCEDLIKRHPRQSFLLANKLPPWLLNSGKDCDKIFNESLRRCGTDYFDFYLIHSLDDANARLAEDNGAYEWAAEQKEKGAVKHVGFSFHGSAALLEHILTAHPEMEFVQLQINYVDVLRGQAGELHKIALKHKKPIIVMEPIRGGALAELPAEAEALLKEHAPGRSAASWAMRYAASFAGVTCVLSGMSATKHVTDNISTFNPLVLMTDEEYAVIAQVIEELVKVASIPCTACKYCLADCPQNIEISVCFSLYNEGKRGGDKWNRQALYNSIPAGQRASDCTRCGACLSHCPQHIDIPNELAVAAKYLS